MLNQSKLNYIFCESKQSKQSIVKHWILQSLYLVVVSRRSEFSAADLAK